MLLGCPHIRPSLVSSFGLILLPRCLMNGLSNLVETHKEYSLAPTNDLIRFWRSEVKFTAGMVKASTLTYNRFGDRRFAVAGPRLWNSLPISLRQISSFRQFRRYLKNHLFGIWEITAQCDAWFSALYKYSYLLTYLTLGVEIHFLVHYI